MPLLPFIRNYFNLTYTRSALVVSAFTLSYGIGQLPAGWLADRIGPRILITVGILGVAVAGVLVGLSQTYIMMLVFLVLMGLAGGGYHPAATPLISASVEPQKRGRALGFHGIGGNLSYFLAPIIAAAIAAAWGWRASFIGLAIPAAAFGIIMYVFIGRRLIASHDQPAGINLGEETSPAPGNIRRLVVFMVLVIIALGVGASLMAFIPLYLVDHFGVSEQTAASLLSIIFSAGLWAGPLGGYLSDRIGRLPIILGSTFFSGILFYLLTVVPYGWGIGDLFFVDGLGMGALLLFFGISMALNMPASESYIAGQTTARHRSTVFGIYYFAMQQAGGVFAPIMGVIIDKYGFHSSFIITSAVVVAVTLICSVFLWGSQD
jgi:FSR family fosmidomycin resistance protein-like MFS transporter